MKNLIFLLLVSVLIVSCNSNDEDDEGNFYALETGIEFRVVSPEGIDLLNPNNENSFLTETIKIYYLVNGNVKEIYNSNLSLPRNFKIVSPEDSGIEKYYMKIFLNNTELIDTITYVEWNETDTDTIKASFRSGNNFMFLSKAWYNNELLFDENTSESLPEIIKN